MRKCGNFHWAQFEEKKREGLLGVVFASVYASYTGTTHPVSTMKVIPTLCVSLVSAALALAQEHIFDLDFNLPDRNDKEHNFYKDVIHDPSRTYLSIYSVDEVSNANNSTNFINPELVDNFHTDDNGVFHVRLPDAGKYQMNFQSLDLFFAATSQFKLTVTEQSSDPSQIQIKIQQFLPGLHNTLQEKLPSITVNYFTTPVIINGAYFNIGIKQYLQPDVGGLFTSLTQSIPFLGTILNNKWLTIASGVMFAIGVLPFILTKIDPDFADQLVESQVEAANAAKSD